MKQTDSHFRCLSLLWRNFYAIYLSPTTPGVFPAEKRQSSSASKTKILKFANPQKQLIERDTVKKPGRVPGIRTSSTNLSKNLIAKTVPALLCTPE